MLKDPSVLDVSFLALESHQTEKKNDINKNRVEVMNTEIIENLGQVDLCICDKTGTLTENSLNLRRLYMDNLTFVLNSDVTGNSKGSSGAFSQNKKFSIDSIQLVKQHLEQDSEELNAPNLFLCMNLCHSAIVSQRKGSQNRDFVSESEDELTFLMSTK